MQMVGSIEPVDFSPALNSVWAKASQHSQHQTMHCSSVKTTPGGIPKADEIGACGALTPWKWWKEVFAILHDSKQLLWRLFYHSAYEKKDKYTIDFTFELVSGGYYIHREVGRECVKSGVSQSDQEGWNVWIYNFVDWATNICNTYIVQYLKKKRQSGNEIWPINKI